MAYDSITTESTSHTSINAITSHVCVASVASLGARRISDESFVTLRAVSCVREYVAFRAVARRAIPHRVSRIRASGALNFWTQRRCIRATRFDLEAFAPDVFRCCAACIAAPSINASSIAMQGADVVSVSVERIAVVRQARA